MRKTTHIALAVTLIVALLCGCKPLPKAPDSEPTPSEEPTASMPQATPTLTPTTTPSPTLEERQARYVDDLMSEMSLEDMVSQLFILQFDGDDGVSFTEASDELTAFVKDKNVGGYVLLANHITTRRQTRDMLNAVREASTYAPFIAIDEEGGTVSRLASAGIDGYVRQPAAGSLGTDTDAAYAVGTTIGGVLRDIGVNVDFAPVADVLTNPNNIVIGSRSYGSDPQLVGDMVSAMQRGLHDKGILTAPKHFPGHGGTAGDSHEGYVSIGADAAQLAAVEYVPFIRAIEEGAQFIMIGHITAPNADNSGLPASLSPYFLKDVLRGQLGYDGILISDAMNMGAIVEQYSPQEAAVMAIEAGMDIILMPEDYQAAANGVLAAVERGDLSEERIDESVRRILYTKVKTGVIPMAE